MATVIRNKLIGRRYELSSLLGQGGMGSVYHATDHLTGNEVALKRVIAHPESIDLSTSYNENDFRLALAQEFRLLATMRHPHVIEVLDYGFDDDQQTYFTMELLENSQSILDASQDQPFHVQLEYIVQTLHALAYLHRRGVLHRDLKPANILVVNGQVKVLDFGLSVMRDRSGSEDEVASATAGTLAYMAPEVLMGHPPTEMGDLYAIGMIAFEIFSGNHPFGASDAGDLINQILFTQPDIHLIHVGIETATIIQRLLQKEPSDRYASAQEVIEALESASDHKIVQENIAIRESFLQAARLIGREHELRKLTEALDIAKQGNGSLWLISGESGVGKSRIVDELRTLAMVSGALVMRGQSIHEGGSPYQMWKQIFRWLGLLANLDKTEAGLIKLLVSDIVALPEFDVQAASVLDPNQVQTRLLNILQSTFRTLNQTVVILLEDLHWASTESIIMLDHFRKMIQDLPILIIASYRDDERPDLSDLLSNAPILKLNRLSDEHIADLSRAMLGEIGGQHQVLSLLQRETEGNVFFLIEVVRALAEEAGHLEEIGRMTLPQHVFAGGVQLIIQRRLDKLTLDSHHLLEIAAVIGRQQDIPLLRIIEPDADVEKWLTECANASVLDVQDGDWRFAHDKIRDVILASMEDSQRKNLHQKVAEAIEQRYDIKERAPLLAHHWRIATNHAKESFYVSLAGEQALRSGAYQEAVKFFERAIDLIESSGVDPINAQMQRVYLQHRQAESYLGFGGYAEAEQLYEYSLTISEEMEDVPGIARSLYALGDVYYATGSNELAREQYQKSLTMYQQINDQSGVAKALNSLGNIAYEVGDHTIAKQLYQQSLNLAREIGNQWGMAGSISKDTASTVEEDIHDIQNTIKETLETHSKAGNKQGMADALFDLGNAEFEKKSYDLAKHHFENSLALRQEISDFTGMIIALERLGAVSSAQEKMDEALMYLRRALSTAVKAANNHLGLKVLLSVAHLKRSSHPEDSLEILAFIVNFPGTPEAIEDEAEQIVFDLQKELPQQVSAHYWDRGKNNTYEKLVEQVLAI